MDSDLLGRLSQLDARQRELFLKALQDQIESTVDNRSIPEKPVGGPLPLSFAQERLWFLNQLDPESPFYNVGRVFHLEGDLSVEALAKSLAEVVRRHEVLRTRFPGDLSGAVQQITASVDEEMTYTDVRGANANARAYALAADDVQRPFDVTSDFPWRARIIHYGDAHYLFVLVLHHIAVDGWSLPILFREISQFYRQFREHGGVELSPLTFQYAHFALWEREKWSERNDAEHQKRLSYWRNQLQNLPDVLPFPSDFQRPLLPAHEGALEPVALSAGATSALTKFAADRGVSLATVLLAGFQALLARYMGRKDVVVAQAVSNRGRTEFEQLIGLFVNTIPVRTDLSGRPTFGQFVEQVQRVGMEAYSYRDLPFEMILKAAKTGPNHNLTSLTQIMFGFDNFSDCRLNLEGVIANPIGLESIHNGGAKADLELSLTTKSGRVTGLIGYKTDLFLPATIRRFWKYLAALLERGALAPETRIDQIPILSPEERHQVVTEWNNTCSEFPREQTLAEMFEEQVQARSEAVALESGDEKVSYAELNRRANRWAHYLILLGVGPDVRVAVYAESSIEVIASLLATMKAGGAYAPIEPKQPGVRLETLLAEIRPAVVVTEAGLVEEVPQGWPLVILKHEQTEAELKRMPSDNPARRTSPENLAYVMYTTGFTGRPKAVAMTQRNVMRLVKGTDHAELGPEDVFLQLAPLAFDASTFEIWGTLLNGGRLIVEREQAQEPDRLAQLAQLSGGATACLTAALFNQMMKAAPEAGGFKRLVAGGESADIRAVSALLTSSESSRPRNGNGPIECAMFSTWHWVKDIPAGWPVSIGRRIANARAYVVDSELEPVPVEVEGDLYIGGEGLARGYWQRPDLTAERFVPDPFSDEPGARLYLTGDQVRWRQDGTLEFLGVRDDLINLLGFRIDLSQVEAALRSYAAVDAAIVLLRGERADDKRLVAYVAGKPGAEDLREDRLLEHIESLLPGYMMPAAIVVLEKLPLTHNGRIDREALPVRNWERRQFAGIRIPPRNTLEETLRQIWAEVLGIHQDKIMVFDSFFALGGESLLATQVVARIRKRLKTEFPMRWIFESPTIARLAERCMAAPGPQPEFRASASVAPVQAKAVQLRALEENVESAPTNESFQEPGGAEAREPAQSFQTSAEIEQPILKLEQRQSFPLSFAQQRLWFLDRLTSESSLYNVPVLLHLRGRLNVEALEQSLRDLSVRHEVLRTRYVMEDGQLRQKVEPEQIVLEVRDCGEGEAAAVLEAQREASRAFDLERGPLFRAVLLRIAEENQILILNLHHSITDGWSIQVMSRELKAAYEARLEMRKPNLSELSIQYGDFAAWHLQWVQEEVLKRQLPYWREQLDGVACLELPSDQQRSPIYSHRGGTTQRRLPNSLNRSLRDLSTREETTLFMTLLAAFQALMVRYTGQTDISVGTPIAGRNRIELEPLIGFFVNTLVMRTRVGEQWSFRRLLQEVRDVALGAYAHQDAPFEKLVEELRPKRDLSHTPLFQVMFAVESKPASQFELHGLRTSQFNPERQLSKFDLAVAFTEDRNEASLTAIFRTDLFKQATMERLLGHYEYLLHEVVANPEQTLWQVPLMSERERQQLLQLSVSEREPHWNSNSSIVELFEQQAQLRPDAVALSFEGQTLTYRELNERANQLAHYLRSLGVDRDVQIGTLMERSIEMVVALLGILKAGGAYVPLDPSYPKERLAFMIKDARAPILLTVELFAPVLSEYGARVVRLDTGWREISKAADENPVNRTMADNLAYVIYTSGSTGKPKGTMVTHHNVVRLLEATQHWFNFDRNDVWTLFHSSAFDFSVWEIWGALLNGGRLEIVPYLMSRSPDDFYDLMCERGVTVLNQTPSAFGQLIGAEERLADSKALSLRLVILGGEALELQSLKPWFERHGDSKPLLVNMYGITETTVHVTYRPISEQDLTGSHGSMIGKAIPDLRVYILDRQMEPAPIGVAGEMYVGGAGLARGYLGRAGLTAERYIPNPFAVEGGARLYRTGDLARYKADGDILYLGRSDQQRKVRGYRIELGEIEAVLKQHEEVSEAVVVDRDEEAGKRLVAYVVCDGAPGASQLRDYLREKLPDYMVPQSFVMIDALPLTVNGKTDRNALLKLEMPSQQSESSAPPASAPERQIAQVWEKFLPVERAGVEDNFFDLGGHSLLATKVLWSLKEIFPALTLLDLFSYPTIRSLAQHLTGQGVEESAAVEGASRAKLRLELRERQQQTRRAAVSDAGSH